MPAVYAATAAPAFAASPGACSPLGIPTYYVSGSGTTTQEITVPAESLSDCMYFVMTGGAGIGAKCRGGDAWKVSGRITGLAGKTVKLKSAGGGSMSYGGKGFANGGDPDWMMFNYVNGAKAVWGGGGGGASAILVNDVAVAIAGGGGGGGVVWDNWSGNFEDPVDNTPFSFVRGKGGDAGNAAAQAGGETSFTGTGVSLKCTGGRGATASAPGDGGDVSHAGLTPPIFSRGGTLGGAPTLNSAGGVIAGGNGAPAGTKIGSDSSMYVAPAGGGGGLYGGGSGGAVVGGVVYEGIQHYLATGGAGGGGICYVSPQVSGAIVEISLGSGASSDSADNGKVGEIYIYI